MTMGVVAPPITDLEILCQALTKKGQLNPDGTYQPWSNKRIFMKHVSKMKESRIFMKHVSKMKETKHASSHTKFHDSVKIQELFQKTIGMHIMIKRTNDSLLEIHWIILLNTRG